MDGVDAVKLRLERRVAGLLDGRLVHAARVVVGELLLVAARLEVLPLGQVFENQVELFRVGVAQLLEAPPARVGGGDRVLRNPPAVGALVEVLAGPDAGGETREFEARERVAGGGLRARSLLTVARAARSADQRRRRGQHAQGGDTPKPERFHGCKLLTKNFRDCYRGTWECPDDNSRRPFW